jgi:protein TonB
VLALPISAAAHLAAAALLCAELSPRADAGAILVVEIMREPGLASAAPAPVRAAAPGGALAAAKPEGAPSPPRPMPPSAPGTAAEAPPLPATPPRADAMKVPAPLALPLEQPAPLLRPPAAPAPALEPRKPLPGGEAAVKSAAPERRQRTPVMASDVGPAAARSAPPGAGPAPDAAATPPRYGLGSAANPLPRYPREARERGWEGLVLLSVGVAADGRAESVEVRNSSGHSVLDQAAAEAVRRWRFEPARRAGVPVAANAEVPIRFRLED